VPVVVNRAGAGARLNAQSKTARCASASCGAFDRSVLVQVLDDFLHFLRVVAEPLERARHRAVDDFQHPAADHFLYLMSAMSGSMPVVSQSIMKAIVPVGAITVAASCGSRPRYRL